MSWRDERGYALSIWAVLAVTAFTLIVGIAVDLSGQVAAKSHAGAVAAQAARTAAQQLDAVGYMNDGRSREVQAAQARTAALATIGAAGMTGTVTFPTPTTLEVTVTARYTPLFLSSLGVGPLQVTGSATTRLARALNGTER